ncbi:MAG: SGNH/GDSL hydrolase family protein [Eubacteriales bacterium]|nr:SGNH/GDSL hydrolase family protein [Eubacteriales bacterium]
MAEKSKYDEEGGAVSVSGVGYEAGRKNVLLIGDSIRMGYCDFTKEQLKNAANVYYPDDNCKFAQNILVCLGWWADVIPQGEKVDVVHWNCGHWDIAKWHGEEMSLNSIEEYTIMLERIHNAIKRLFPDATEIFATTTPMNPDGTPAKNERTTAEIIEYNKAAVALMNKLGVKIDDIFEAAKDLPSSYYSDYCHYTKEGFDLLGKKVADYIIEFL